MRWVSFGSLLLSAACGLGCRGDASMADDPLHLGTAAHEATFEQRDTQTVPDTMGRLSIVLGDVEGADLVELVELVDNKDGKTVLTVRDLRVGAKKSFKIDRTKYRFELIETDSSHLLHDTATFTFWQVD